MASTIQIENNAALDQLLLTNPKMEKLVRSYIRKAVLEARNRLAASAQSGLRMKSDPRGAAHAVRYSVYKAVMGGNLNIIRSRKAGKRTIYKPHHTLVPGQRGGNRVPRGLRTAQMMSYGPHDRQMILMWLAFGTDQREAGTKGGRLHGNRGAIAARGWFGPYSHTALEQAADKLAQMIDETIEKVMQ